MNLCYICVEQKMGVFTRRDSPEVFSRENSPERNLTEVNSPGQGDSRVRIS